jgi:Glycosyl transferase family 2
MSLDRQHSIHGFAGTDSRSDRTPMQYKRVAKKVLRRIGLRKPSSRWVVAADQPAAPDPLPSFGLFAIVATWMEADVIEATVRNAFAQGCERVLLVDNDSPDDTVDIATVAGAELARSFSTASVDEVLKIRLLNQTVWEVSERDGRDHIWWLWLDADEFVHGPAGMTLRDYLTGLDRQYRIVGTRYFNHFPDRAPESLPGFHPLDLQPLCQEKSGNLCALGHRKHPVQRYDRGGPNITSGIGFHAARAAETLVEPTSAVFTHHFPYRFEQTTRARFAALCGRTGTSPARVEPFDRQVVHNAGTISDMSKRYRTLDSVYRQDWAQVENLRRSGRVIGVEPEPWTTLVVAEDARTARWYEPEQLIAAAAQHRTSA